MNEEQERIQQQERWRDLAKQLGIDESEAPPPASPPARDTPTKETPTVPKHDLRQEIAPVQHRENPVPEEDVEPWEPEPQAWAEPIREEQAAGPERRHDGSDRSAEDDRPRRGRRGRKGRHGRKDDERPLAAASQMDDSSPAAGDSEEEDSPRSPGRHGEAADLEDARHSERNEEENEIAKDVQGEEEEDNFADWNVPSWTELIASLYRPDR